LIGKISVQDTRSDSSAFTLGCDEKTVIGTMRDKACSLGADAIKLYDIEPYGWRDGGVWKACFEAKALILSSPTAMQRAHREHVRKAEENARRKRAAENTDTAEQRRIENARRKRAAALMAEQRRIENARQKRATALMAQQRRIAEESARKRTEEKALKEHAVEVSAEQRRIAEEKALKRRAAERRAEQRRIAEEKALKRRAAERRARIAEQRHIREAEERRRRVENARKKRAREIRKEEEGELQSEETSKPSLVSDTLSLEEAKTECEEIGLTPKTERFGECVLQLTQ
jgi:hypothetical protein